MCVLWRFDSVLTLMQGDWNGVWPLIAAHGRYYGLSWLAFWAKNWKPFEVTAGPFHERARDLADMETFPLERAYVVPVGQPFSSTAMPVFRGNLYVSEYLMQTLSRSEVDAVVRDEFRYQARLEEFSDYEKSQEGAGGLILQLIGLVVGVGFSFVADGTALAGYMTPVVSIAVAVIVYGALSGASEPESLRRPGRTVPARGGRAVHQRECQAGPALPQPVALALDRPGGFIDGRPEAARQTCPAQGYVGRKGRCDFWPSPGSRDFYDVTPRLTPPAM